MSHRAERMKEHQKNLYSMVSIIALYMCVIFAIIGFVEQNVWMPIAAIVSLIASQISEYRAEMPITEEVIKEKNNFSFRKKKGVKMPRLFRWFMYLMVLMLMWKFVSNIEHIVGFFVSKI